MLAYLQDQLTLATPTMTIAAVVILSASVVRGFSGFGLTALIMAGLTPFIPPVALIPLCHLLEFMASTVMLRSGLKKADKRIALGLAAGSVLGLPLGLAITLAASEELSQLMALLAIVILAILQLTNRVPACLDSRWGLYLSGLTSGIITGICGAGGMVVALYVLALNRPAAQIRATIVLYLFITFFTTGTWLLFAGLMDLTALKRGLMFAPLVIAGAILGSLLFMPRLEPWYKRICLFLLLGLAASGLMRI